MTVTPVDELLLEQDDCADGDVPGGGDGEVVVGAKESIPKRKPDFSLEWKDLKIEIKVYGKVGTR